METKTVQTQIRNGVNVTKLFETIESVKAAPVIAKFRFRTSNQWQDGGHNRSTIDGFYGIMEDVPHQKPFVMDSDEPPVLLGEDRGANPVEYLLHALAACVTTTMIYHAAARGIEIQELESTLEGDIDLHGFLGISDEIRRGYQQIRMNFRIRANAPDEKLAEIVALGPTFSPVFDSLTNGVDVKVSFEKK